VYDRAWSSLYLYMVVVTDMLKLTSTLAMELETNIKSSSILPLDSSESKRSAALNQAKARLRHGTKSFCFGNDCSYSLNRAKQR
jgi:hypothetical protein